jgi:hypothetical protein
MKHKDSVLCSQKPVTPCGAWSCQLSTTTSIYSQAMLDTWRPRPLSATWVSCNSDKCGQGCTANLLKKDSCQQTILHHSWIILNKIKRYIHTYFYLTEYNYIICIVHTVTHMPTVRHRLSKHIPKVTLSTVEGYPLLGNKHPFFTTEDGVFQWVCAEEL